MLQCYMLQFTIRYLYEIPINTDWKPDIAEVCMISNLGSNSKSAKQDTIPDFYAFDAIALLFALITI